jgi:hypothetical protein
MAQRTTSRDSKLLGARLRIHVPVDPYERPDVYAPGAIYSAKPSGELTVHPLGKAPSPHGR